MATTIQISAIEVNQALQHLGSANPVPLIHGKRTYLRVYCKVSADKKNPLSDQRWSANLVCSYKDNTGKTHELTIPPMQAVRLADLATDQATARSRWDAALCFDLRDSNFFKQTEKLFKDCSTKLTLTFCSLSTTDSTVVVKPLKEKSVVFDAPLEFFCRAISYSYQDPETGDIAEPTSGELHVIRDFIESAFPVSKVNWSYNAIEAPRTFKQVRQSTNENPFEEEKIDLLYQLLFQHLVALRAQETSLKDDDRVDPRTIYIGVLSDPTNRFGGASMDSPAYATPHIVAFAETQTDGALAAHEISHLLGALHPGIPDKKVHGRLLGQTSQTDTPAALGLSDIGQIASPDSLPREKRLIGLRTLHGNGAPELMDSSEYFDLTTYRTPSWLSQHTYTLLYKRLREIQNLDFTDADSRYINVVGSYNLINKSATVQYALESSIRLDSGYTENSTAPFISPLKLKPVGEEAENDEDGSIYIRRNPDRTDTNFSLGVFQYSIKKRSGLRNSTYQLQINGNVVDTLAFPVLSEMARTRLLHEEVVTCNKALTTKVTEAGFDGLDKFIAAAEKKASVCHTLGNALTFQFHLGESSLYLNYNWSVPLVPKGEPAVKKAAIEALLNNLAKKTLPAELALQLLHYSQVPITTIVELKYPTPSPDTGDHTAAPDKFENLDRWETVYISNRLSNHKVWVPHRYVIQSLKTYARGGAGFPVFDIDPDNHKKSAIFNIRCRVTLVAAGHTIKLYESPITKNKAKTPLPTYAPVIGNISSTRKNDGQQYKTNKPPNTYDTAVDFQRATFKEMS